MRMFLVWMVVSDDVEVCGDDGLWMTWTVLRMVVLMVVLMVVWMVVRKLVRMVVWMVVSDEVEICDEDVGVDGHLP